MPSTKNVLIVVALVTAVIAFIGLFLRNLMGKPVRGTLRAPQGKNHVDVTVSDDKPLRPFKYSQVFEVAVVAKTADQVAVAYKDKPVGVADPSNPYTRVLHKLLDRHPSVVVSAVIMSIDDKGRPLMQLCLPDAGWFKRALKPYGE